MKQWRKGWRDEEDGIEGEAFGVEGMMEPQRGRRRRAAEGYISRWERWRSDGGSYRGRRDDGETGARRRRRRRADRAGRER